MKTILLILSTVFVLSTAEARLGENITECYQRYGEPVQQSPDRYRMAFEKSGILILIHFDTNRRAELILFSAIDEDRNLIAMTGPQIDTIVAANLGEGIKKAVTGEQIIWNNPVTKSKAAYDIASNTLMVSTMTGLENQKEGERQALSGF